MNQSALQAKDDKISGGRASCRVHARPKSMIRFAIFSFLVVALTSAHCTSWLWMSAGDYLRDSDLIAVVDVGEVHEVFTPEGILVRSARARVIRTLYWKFAKDSPLPDSVVIYDADPNAVIEDDGVPTSNSYWRIKPGRAFAVLQMRGELKFRPYDRLSLQYLGDDERAMWPVPPRGTEPMSVDKIMADIQQALKKNNKS